MTNHSIDQDVRWMRRSIRPAAALGAVLAIALGAGCSAPSPTGSTTAAPTTSGPTTSGVTAGASTDEAGKPAAQILSDAQRAADQADSVHISGTVARTAAAGTSTAAPATATLDLLLTSSGDGREQITGTGQDIDLIKVGQTLYVKGLGGSGVYQHLSVGDPRTAPLVAQLDKKSVFDQLIRPGSTPTIAGRATVDGQPAVTLAVGGGAAGLLYVADDTAHPYPLKVETAASGAAAGPTGALVFSDWNTHAVVTPPS